MADKNRRIGLWGGSFNPPTLAHKALANYAFSELHLDEMHWIVCPHNPEKDAATLAPFDHRLAMVEQILADTDAMLADDIEQRQGSSITINTVKALRKLYPDDYLFFFMGTDNWLGFHQWGDDFARIFDYVSLVVFNRPGIGDINAAQSAQIFADRRVGSIEKMGKSGNWFVLNNPQYDMSATQARNALAKGDIPLQLAPQTFDYITKHRLYQK